MTPFIALDLGRLAVSALALAPTPRGLDRVEYLYACHFLNHWRGDCAGVLPTPWGSRRVSRARAHAAIAQVARLWREHIPAESDPAFVETKAALRGAATPGRADPAQRKLHAAALLMRELGMTVGRSARQALPTDSLLLSVGQIGPTDRHLLSLLRRRQDLRAVFMLHDTIPLDHPEYVSGIL